MNLIKYMFSSLILFFIFLFSQPGYSLINQTSRTLSADILSNAHTLNPKVLDLALVAFDKLKQSGKIKKPYITLIDYSLPSSEKRLWLIDLNSKKVLLHTWVSHGSKSGENYTKYFSNNPGSHQSSLGVFVTGETYQGKYGTSLTIHGLEQGINHNVQRRGVVVHGAPYVSQRFIRDAGRLGRSWGCPAVSFEVSKMLIQTIKQGSMIFSYYPNETWLKESEFIV